MSGTIFTSIFKIIWTVAVLNTFLLISLPFIAEYISGEEILSDSLEPSKDIEARIMLTENEMVTIIFKTTEQSLSSELLSIVVTDPQNREHSWEKEFDASDEPGTQI